MTDFRTTEPIVVGVDGSEPSIDALRRAARIASALDTPLKAVTVWQYPVMFDSFFPAIEWSPEDDAHKVLASALEEAFDGAPPESLIRSVRQGTAAHVLIEESNEASMLVLGSRGHGGFTGMLLGSVSSACAEHAHCPVLIIHAHQVQTETTADTTLYATAQH